MEAWGTHLSNFCSKFEKNVFCVQEVLYVGDNDDMEIFSAKMIWKLDA